MGMQGVPNTVDAFGGQARPDVVSGFSRTA